MGDTRVKGVPGNSALRIPVTVRSIIIAGWMMKVSSHVCSSAGDGDASVSLNNSSTARLAALLHGQAESRTKERTSPQRCFIYVLYRYKYTDTHGWKIKTGRTIEKTEEKTILSKRKGVAKSRGRSPAKPYAFFSLKLEHKVLVAI
ncbi:hypothetical protein KQX54_005235 [Cotesia glomerata]|uniref:Uncharacterized protein n=1 Tax=Cotesia glomerata TaxID=32391 RepID=A0AAV7HHX0_COTGL|nr:hypothetical protein KQX54_005235 [Cotesia glomerata]